MATMEGEPVGSIGDVGPLGDEWAFTLYGGIPAPMSRSYRRALHSFGHWLRGRLCKRKVGCAQDQEQRQDEERHEQEHENATALNALKQAYIDVHESDERKNFCREIREWATIILVLITVVLTWMTYRVFYQTMLDARLASYIAHLDNIASQDETADALKQSEANAAIAHIDTAAALAKSDAANQISSHAIIAANRAWIAPRNVAFAAPFKIGETIKLRMFYDNVGHQAAQNSAFNAVILRVENPPYRKTYDLLRGAIGKNSACSRAVSAGCESGFPRGSRRQSLGR